MRVFVCIKLLIDVVLQISNLFVYFSKRGNRIKAYEKSISIIDGSKLHSTIQDNCSSHVITVGIILTSTIN